MEREGRMEEAERRGFETESFSRDCRIPGETGGRPAPGWKAWVISVIVAAILSVTATLLLGGSFRLTGGIVSGGCGAGRSCCPPSDGK